MCVQYIAYNIICTQRSHVMHASSAACVCSAATNDDTAAPPRDLNSTEFMLGSSIGCAFILLHYTNNWRHYDGAPLTGRRMRRSRRRLCCALSDGRHIACKRLFLYIRGLRRMHRSHTQHKPSQHSCHLFADLRIRRVMRGRPAVRELN